jgi:hypothetical protein
MWSVRCSSRFAFCRPATLRSCCEHDTAIRSPPRDAGGMRDFAAVELKLRPYARTHQPREGTYQKLAD